MTDETPTNHFAYGAVDDDGNGYIVLEPLNAEDARLELTAIPLPTSAGLALAESLAADFNSGASSGFWTSPGQAVSGDRVPRLHRAPRIGWKQCLLPFPENIEPIQSAVADLHLALTAAKGMIPQHFALFMRDAGDDRMNGSVLLLSPAAAQYADRLPGGWTEAQEIDAHGWGGLYTNAGDQAALGLRPENRFR